MQKQYTQRAQSPTSYIWLSKNFLHAPIIRPAHAAPAWRRRFGQRWTARLHGASLECSSVGLPPPPQKPATPDRYDLDVLLRLGVLALRAEASTIHQGALVQGKYQIERQRRRRLKGDDPDVPTWTSVYDAGCEQRAGRQGYKRARKIYRRAGTGQDVALTFKSMRALLAALGRAPSKVQNVAAVRNSLKLWSDVSVRFDKWRSVGGSKKPRGFAPFIAKLAMPLSGRGKVQVVLSADFVVTMRGGYKTKIPLPLPLQSEGTLSLYLWLSAFEAKPRQIGYGSLCAKLGITGPGWRAGRALYKTLATVNAHRARHGLGEYTLKPVADGTMIRFLPPRRKQRPAHLAKDAPVPAPAAKAPGAEATGGNADPYAGALERSRRAALVKGRAMGLAEWFLVPQEGVDVYLLPSEHAKYFPQEPRRNCRMVVCYRRGRWHHRRDTAIYEHDAQ